MLRKIRTFGIILVLAPLAAMFSEPFFAVVLHALGIDTAAWATKMMNLITTSSSSPVFFPLCTLGIGIGSGILIHWAAARKESQGVHSVLKDSGAKDLEFETFDLEGKFEVIEGKAFSNTVVPLDGKHYTNCKFTNVTLEFNATKPCKVTHCDFYGSFRVSTLNIYSERFSALLNAFGMLGVPAFDNGEVISPQVKREAVPRQ